jgi:hypothetical protein
MGRVRDGFSDTSQVADIKGAVVCTTAERAVVEEAALVHGAPIMSLDFETSDEMYEVFIAGGCDLVVDDYSTLVSLREGRQPTDQDWVIFGLGFIPSSPSATTPTTTAAPVTTVPESVGERNAREKAASYLEYTAFSRSGLIEQLEFSGFTTTQAEYGTNAVGADWNAQAALKAASYLEYSAFSRSGLIEQLEFSGFTRTQAEYGVGAVGY